VDEAVAIDEVKRFIAQRDLDASTRYVPPVVVPSVLQESLPQRVAIVGAGPAGLSCAFYLAQKGYHPVVFERAERPGGMLTYGIPSYKLEKDVVDAEIDVIRQLGVEIRCGVDVGTDVTLDELREQGFSAFYLAIGCQGSRAAGIEGEDAEGVEHAVDFLRGAASGQGRKLDGDVVVIGGGNVAVDAARVSSRCGAGKVTMVSLELADEMPAGDEELDEAATDGVAFEHGWGPLRVEVTDGHVTGVVLKRCTRVYDDQHRFSPTYDETDTRTIACSHLVLAIGQSIQWGDLLAGSAVELGRGNGPQADPVTYQTAQPDIFVGGDVLTGPRFAIDAIAAGHEAAVSIHRFVQPGSSLTIGRNPRAYVELDKSAAMLPVGGYDTASRQRPTTDERDRDGVAATDSFRDVSHALTAEQVKAETARCLGCGASVVDPNKCIGCGLCTTRCDFDAIHLSREHPEATHMIPAEDKLKLILPYAAKRQVKIVRKKIVGR
jgi:NADPH-dependent glutamate synthase beta subunit-like oxidoreductase